MLWFLFLLACGGEALPPQPSVAERDLALLLQAESDGTDVCGEIGNPHVQQACQRILERAHLRGRPAVPPLAVTGEVLLPCREMSGADRDTCVLETSKHLGQEAGPASCLGIASPVLRRECVVFHGGADWVQGVDAADEVCSGLGEGDRAECRFELAELRAVSRFGEALALCQRAEDLTPMCARHVVRVKVQDVVARHRAGPFLGLVAALEAVEEEVGQSDWHLGGAPLAHTVWSDAFHLLAAVAVTEGRVGQFLSLAGTVGKDRAALWTAVLETACIRDELAQKKSDKPAGGSGECGQEEAFQAVEGGALFLKHQSLLEGPALPAPWNRKIAGRALSFLPDWAEPRPFWLGTGCPATGEGRELLIRTWASADVPLTDRKSVLEAGLLHPNPVVRGYTLGQIARAVWKGEGLGVLADSLGRHAGVEDQPLLNEIGTWLLQAKAGDDLSQKTMDAAMEPLCRRR